MNQKIKTTYNLEQDNMKWFDLARLEIPIYLERRKYTPSVLEFPVVLRSVVVFKFAVVLVSRDVHLT